MSILIVDDSAALRKTVRFALETAGFEVEDAADGAHGLALALQHDYELIISDLNMINMGGFEMIERIRRSDRHQHTPILILSTETHPDLKAKGRRLGATGWIAKPFSPEQLIATCQRAISKQMPPD